MGAQLTLFVSDAADRPVAAISLDEPGAPAGCQPAVPTSAPVTGLPGRRPPRRRARREAAEPDPKADLLRRSLPLTVRAPNWEAWCDRPLRVEIEARRARASLPMVMGLREGEALSPIPHGRFAGCELSGCGYWLAEPDGIHGTVLVPRGRFFVRDGKNGHVEDRGIRGVRLRVADEDGFTRPGPCPDAAAAIARRLDAATVAARGDWPLLHGRVEIQDEDLDRMMAALVGARLALRVGFGRVFGDAFDHLEVTSRPFRVTDAGGRAGSIRIAGTLGIGCEAGYDRLLGVRVSESALGSEIIIDLWRDGEGFGAAWHLRFSHIPGGDSR